MTRDLRINKTVFVAHPCPQSMTPPYLSCLPLSFSAPSSYHTLSRSSTGDWYDAMWKRLAGSGVWLLSSNRTLSRRLWPPCDVCTLLKLPDISHISDRVDCLLLVRLYMERVIHEISETIEDLWSDSKKFAVESSKVINAWNFRWLLGV